MRANPAKCAMLPVTTNARGNPVVDVACSLQLHGEAIPTLGIHESYSYLGVGDGFDHVRHRLQLDDKIKQIKLEAVTLLRSALAPWQILKALKVYVYPKVEFALRHVRPLRSQLDGFDRAVVRGVKHLLRLGATATTEVLYAPASSGGLGLLPLTELHDTLQVAHAWQMLHSVDPSVRAIAREQVVQICRVRHGWTLTTGAGRSAWRSSCSASSTRSCPVTTRPSQAAQRRHRLALGRRPAPPPDLEPEVLIQVGGGPGGGAALPGAAPPQVVDPQDGAAAPETPPQAHAPRQVGRDDRPRTHGAGAWQHWRQVRDERGRLSDAEYRVALQARLNQLDTNSVLKRKRLRANATCRAPGCSRAETTAHVLNHCAPNMRCRPPAPRRRTQADRWRHRAGAQWKQGDGRVEPDRSRVQWPGAPTGHRAT